MYHYSYHNKCNTNIITHVTQISLHISLHISLQISLHKLHKYHETNCHNNLGGGPIPVNFAKVVTSVTILFLQIAIMALPLGVGPIPEHCEHCHISCFFLQNRFKCAAAWNCISDCHHCVNKTLATIAYSATDKAHTVSNFTRSV